MGPVRITATVAPDGSMAVEERRTFEFNGDYTFVYWTLDVAGSSGIRIEGLSGPEGPYEITNSPTALEDRPPATYVVIDRGGVAEVRAFFRASDETREFTLRYTVLDAATRWSDTGEIYWQFVGDEWELPVTDVAIGVRLPNPGEQVVAGENVRAWAHGPLQGTVSINEDPASSAGTLPGDVILEVPGVPAYTFVEARIAFPAEWLSEMPEGTTPALQQIIAEETELAEEANRQRAAARFAITLSWIVVVGILALRGRARDMALPAPRQGAPGEVHRQVLPGHPAGAPPSPRRLGLADGGNRRRRGHRDGHVAHQPRSALGEQGDRHQEGPPRLEGRRDLRDDARPLHVQRTSRSSTAGFSDSGSRP
jgi:hypothetical protein